MHAMHVCARKNSHYSFSTEFCFSKYKAIPGYIRAYIYIYIQYKYASFVKMTSGSFNDLSQLTRAQVPETRTRDAQCCIASIKMPFSPLVKIQHAVRSRPR